MDGLAIKLLKIIAQAAGVVTTMYAYTLFVYRRTARKPPGTHGPLAKRNKIRMANLRHEVSYSQTIVASLHFPLIINTTNGANYNCLPY